MPPKKEERSETGEDEKRRRHCATILVALFSTLVLVILAEASFFRGELHWASATFDVVRLIQ